MRMAALLQRISATAHPGSHPPPTHPRPLSTAPHPTATTRAVLGAFRALTRLGLARNVVAVLAIAENAIGEHAYKPHAILRSHAGLTVEVKNTDAEGRLVLADALSYAQARHAPHTIIDLATLTGACVVALGEYAAGLFGNSSALRGALVAAGEARGERLWPMPIFEEHREEIRAAATADLQSTGGGRMGGACTAAAFLEFFIGAQAAGAGGGAGAAPAEPAAMPASPSSPVRVGPSESALRARGRDTATSSTVAFIRADL